jgi:hypothetical protein
MKTIRVGNSQNRNIFTLVLLAGLGALYYYQRSGGKVSELLRQGMTGVKSVRNKISEIAPSVSERFGSSTESAHPTLQ